MEKENTISGMSKEQAQEELKKLEGEQDASKASQLALYDELEKSGALTKEAADLLRQKLGVNPEENKDKQVNEEEILKQIKAIKKDQEFIANKKEELVKKGCTKTDAGSIATLEEAVNRAQLKIDLFLQIPGAKNAESELQKFRDEIKKDLEKLSVLKLKYNIEDKKDEENPENKPETIEPVKETENAEKQLSPEAIAGLEKLILDAEVKAKETLESNKFKKNIINGLSKWEKFGQGEEGIKGFLKRSTKMAINLALIGVASSFSIEKLAQNGVVTASALGAGMTANLRNKMLMGLGLGTVMEMMPEKARKWMTIGVGIGSITAASIMSGGVAGIAAGGSMLLGYGAQKFINIYTDEKILKKEEEAKLEFLNKIKSENVELDENKLREIEAGYAKILKKYENQRIWGKVANGALKLFTSTVVSTAAMGASGAARDHMHSGPNQDTTHVNHDATKVVDVKGDHHVAEVKHDDLKVDNKDILKDVVKDQEIKGDNIHGLEKGAVNIHEIKHDIASIKPEETIKTSEIKHDSTSVEHKDTLKTIEVKNDDVKVEKVDNNPLHLKSINDIRDEALAKHQTEIDAKHVNDPHYKTPEEFKTDAKHEVEIKAQTEVKLTKEEMDDAIVHKGEGVENPFIRQIEHNHDLAKELGYKGDLNDEKALHQFAGRQAHLIAEKEGYVDGHGNEVRVAVADKVGYQIKMENGHATVHEIDTSGKILETHHEGDKFSESVSKHEYVEKPNDHPTVNNSEATDTANTKEAFVPEGGITKTPHITEDIVNNNTSESFNREIHYTSDTNNHRDNSEDIPKNNSISTNDHQPGGTTDNNTENSTNSNLNHQEIQQISKVYDHNIHKMFPNSIDENRWEEVSKMDAYKLYRLESEEVRPELRHLHAYMHKLHEVTGLKPDTGDAIYDPATNKEFIEAALEKATKLGKLDKVTL